MAADHSGGLPSSASRSGPGRAAERGQDSERESERMGSRGKRLLGASFCNAMAMEQWRDDASAASDEE